MICYRVKSAAMQVAKNGLSFHSSVFYQATLEDSQLRNILPSTIKNRQFFAQNPR
jgi:hypothetical protein